MTESQIPELVATLVRHQKYFGGLSKEEAQWIIKNPKETISFFVNVFKNDTKMRLRLGSSFVIDCGNTPRIRDGFEYYDEDQISSRFTGLLLSVDMHKIILYQDEEQIGGMEIVGSKLKKKIEGMSVLPANVLDFYLDNPRYIPEEWKLKPTIYFWGSIYRDTKDFLYIRCLSWFGDEWFSDYYWVDNEWGNLATIALLK